MKLSVIILALCVAYASADCYMQNPRGSNNRINGAAANRGNGNRLFDSQNNARGGYNACDKGTNAFENNDNDLYYGAAQRGQSNPDNIYGEGTDRNAAVVYPFLYYAGSKLQMEWTVQHGCGGNEIDDPHKLNCNMVIQYMCDQEVDSAGARDHPLSVYLTDGRNDNTPDTANPNGQDNCLGTGNLNVGTLEDRQDANDAAANGRHESEAWYCACEMRKRDVNLFAADQNLGAGTDDPNRGIYTRQNPNGGRRGLECPEERDYYPTAYPTPFRDLAYLTDDMSRCALIQAESMNVMPKGHCVTNNNSQLRYNHRQHTTKDNCEGAGGKWAVHDYGIPPPDCQQAGYSRVNHLGNGRGDGVNPETVGYNATIPTWDLLTTSKIPVKTYGNGEYAKCIMRLRYNVSTDDYDPWNIDAEANGGASPIEGNPNVPVGASAKLQLAINTNQFGRTFQDRTHVFFIKKPTAIQTTSIAAGARIMNLNVRGKRGNIVQTYPATEYDFTPTNAEARVGDMVHIQWCGSNTHNNGNPAGDGQAGDAGEGTGGTDRHNLVHLKDFDDNFPVPYDKMAQLFVPNLFDNVCTSAHKQEAAGTGLDCALRLATAGLIKNKAGAAGNANINTLDDCPASTVGGGTFITIGEKVTIGTKYKYMATRNNNFTNRGQKGTLEIVAKPGQGGGAGVAAANVVENNIPDAGSQT